jgi:hypothetical protein
MYTWVFDTWFLGRPEVFNFEGLGGPGAPKNHSKGGFGMVLGAAGAAQTPKIDDSWPAQKPCIKNPSVCMLK